MGNNRPEYQGKPTAYLDQNILDLFVDGEHRAFADTLKSNLQIVYSDETLKEIKRSGSHSNKFISVLSNLNAFHLKLVVEQPEFKETGEATLTDCDPNEAFNEYCDSIKEYEGIQLAMEQWMFKYSGGMAGVGIAEINHNQKKAFANLMNDLRSKVQLFSGEIPNIECLFNEYENEMITQHTEALDESERLLKNNISDDKNWSGIKDLRNATGIGPKELNNITHPNVIKKVWEKYRELPQFNAANIEIDEFFGLKQNPIFPDRSCFRHQKVVGLYNMLNSIGYWPDSKVHKERRFVAALSDNNHASMASFCNVLLSRDSAFIKKVRAVYEYLEVPTLVQVVTIKNA